MKKTFALLAVFLIALSLQAQVEPTDTDGDGSRNISTLDHIRWVSKNSSCWADDFELDNNINATATSTWNSDGSGGFYGFSPIGNNTTNFTGSFDGNGYSVQSLYINRSSGAYVGFFGYTSGSTKKIQNIGIENCIISANMFLGGLIGQNISTKITNCYSTGTINGSSTLGGLIGCNSAEVVNCYSTVDITGTQNYIGGLIGKNSSKVMYSYATGNVSGITDVSAFVANNSDTISYCYSTGNASGTNHIGGIVGNNDEGAILYCYAKGNMLGIADQVGGVVGYNKLGVVSNCFAFGNAEGDDFVGGMVGFSSGEILNAYSMGAVTGNSYTGGFIGKRFNGTVTNCFWDTQTSGQNTSDAGTGKTTVEMNTESTFTNASWDFTDVWNIDASENNGYPDLKIINLTPPTDTDGDGYLNISVIQHIRWVSENSCCWADDFELDNNINATATSTWNSDGSGGFYGFSPIGNNTTNFTGIFNGNDFVISNLYINQTNQNMVGFFGSNSGNIKNLGIVDCDITGESYNIGGLVGYNTSGTIDNCFASGEISAYVEYSSTLGGLIGFNFDGIIKNSYSSANVTGWSEIGGFLGKNYAGNIEHCYATGIAKGYFSVGGFVGTALGTIKQCYSTGSALGTYYIPNNETYYVGGFVGLLTGTVENCYSKAMVTGKKQIGGFIGKDNFSTITNSYSSGIVTGTSDVGGFLGLDAGGTFDNCFWDTEASTQSTSDAGTGKTTIEMKTKTTFTNAGWNFNTFWNIDDSENDGYPFFLTEVTQTLTLKQGWNMISFYVVPENTEISDILSPIDGDFIIVKNIKGEIYYPEYSIDKIKKINPQHGYLLYMNKATTLSLTGALIDISTETYDFSTGWSMISYPRATSSDIESSLQAIDGDFIIVKNIKGNIYYPKYLINTIINLEPGQGYLIYIKQATTFNFPEN